MLNAGTRGNSIHCKIHSTSAFASAKNFSVVAIVRTREAGARGVSGRNRRATLDEVNSPSDKCAGVSLAVVQTRRPLNTRDLSTIGTQWSASGDYTKSIFFKVRRGIECRHGRSYCLPFE